VLVLTTLPLLQAPARPRRAEVRAGLLTDQEPVDADFSFPPSAMEGKLAGKLAHTEDPKCSPVHRTIVNQWAALKTWSTISSITRSCFRAGVRDLYLMRWC